MIYMIINSIKNIMVNKTRTILIMLCFAVGVFSLLIISIVSDTGSELISNQLDGIGLYGLCIRFNQNDNNYFTDDDIKKVIELEEIAEVMPMSTKYQSVEAGGKTENCVIWGVDNNAPDILELDLIYGKGLNRQDIEDCSNKCLISEGYAEEKFNCSNAVGKTIEINFDGRYYQFVVCGVVNAGTSDLRKTISNFIPHFIYVNYSAINRISGENKIDRLALKPDEGVNSTVAASKAKKLLEIKYNGQYDLIIDDVDSQLGKVDTIMETLTSILTIIGSISMIITGISIMSVMILSVNERKREIAIKKSIGAGKIRIMTEFLIESVLIAIGGCLAGTIFAGIITIILKIIGLNASIDISGILAVELFAILTGVIFGAYPAFKAAGLKPIDGLKSE